MCRYSSALVWPDDTDLCLDGVTSYCMEEATDIYRKLNSSCCKTSYQVVSSLTCLQINYLFHVLCMVCFCNSRAVTYSFVNCVVEN